MANDENALERGRKLLADLAPNMETVLAERYDALVPGMSESLVEWAYGRQYSRPGLDMRTRMLATVAALTALGGQTRPQLKVNIASAVKSGATREEIGEVIWQMALYGGMPASINALNAALEVFDEIDGESNGRPDSK